MKIMLEGATDSVAGGEVATHEVEVSTDRARLDIALIHAYLSTSSYWAQGRSRAEVERSLAHSLCFGLFTPARQIGFGRVVTDYTVFGYLADIFVLPGYQGQGLGTRLVQAMLEHPDIRGLRLLLRTRDAHAFYASLGFRAPGNLHEFMARIPETT